MQGYLIVEAYGLALNHGPSAMAHAGIKCHWTGAYGPKSKTSVSDSCYVMGAGKEFPGTPESDDFLSPFSF
jgi:hypothetical protein